MLQKSSQNEASGLHFGSQNGAKIARAKGECDQNSAPKCSKRAPKMKPRGSILAPKMVPKWLLEASAALLGANWAPGASPGCSQNAPGDPRDRKKIHCYLPGGLRRNFQARFHPPRGSRGGLWPPFREPPGVILPLLLATSVETTKISQKSGHVYLFFLICGEHFYVMFGTLLPTLLRARRPRKHGNILKIHWFLQVQSHMRLFRATPEATTFQRTGVAKTDRKSMPQKDPTRQDTTNKKTPFWTSKLLIFGAKRAFQKQPGRQERAHARIGSPKIASGALLDSLRGAKKTLVTSKSGLEKFLGRQEGDRFL